MASHISYTEMENLPVLCATSYNVVKARKRSALLHLALFHARLSYMCRAESVVTPFACNSGKLGLLFGYSMLLVHGCHICTCTSSAVKQMYGVALLSGQGWRLGVSCTSSMQHQSDLMAAGKWCVSGLKSKAASQQKVVALQSRASNG